mmetsp:Transcript_39293/g.58375  ORF Transcript_39293/g.58375 Transcript_39293/m.58375 type:complete len:88 (+) Transcript_39293:352-615(+)
MNDHLKLSCKMEAFIVREVSKASALLVSFSAPTIDKIQTMASLRDIVILHSDGSTPNKQRQMLVENDFQNDRLYFLFPRVVGLRNLR